MDDITDNIKADQTDTTKTIEEKQKNLLNLVNTKSKSVDNLVTQQRKMNEVMKDVSTPISNMMTQLVDITDKIKTIFAKLPSN